MQVAKPKTTGSLAERKEPIPRTGRVGPAPHDTLLGLLGQNGSGKSTLIKCRLGLIHPTAGELRLAGEDA